MSNFTPAIHRLQKQIEASTNKRERLQELLSQNPDYGVREIIDALDVHHVRTIALTQSIKASLIEAREISSKTEQAA